MMMMLDGDFRTREPRFRGSHKAVGAELDRIRASKGNLTLKTVLAAARKPTSPLHSLFYWTDAEQARFAKAVKA